MSSSDEYTSGSEYTSNSESSSLETDSEDSYSYPWKDPEIDRFSSFDNLSSDDLMQKILDSLPVYDPPNSDNETLFEYPDPDLYAVRGADPTEEMKVLEEVSPGPNYLPEDDELYLNWVDEFEVVLYPSDFADIDEDDPPPEPKPIEIPVVEIGTSSPEPSDRPQSARTGSRRSTTRAQEIRRANSQKSRRSNSSANAATGRPGRGMSTRLDPFASPSSSLRGNSSRRTFTPDPPRRAASSSVRKSRSATGSPRRPRRANTTKQMKARKGKELEKKFRVGAKRTFRVGKKVKVYGETAVIRYIGEIDDPSMPGEVYGVEFMHATEHGQHDGTLPSGEQIFECEPGQGLFVRKGVVKPVRKHARRQARFVGNVGAFERQNLLRERFDARRRGGKAARKLGPREIGRANDYRPETYELKEDTTSFLAPRATAKSRSAANVKVRKKAGPRDVGRSNYRPQEYSDEITRQDSSRARQEFERSVSPRGPRNAGKKKLGPRDMKTKKSGWKPPKYDIQDSGSFLEDRVVRSKSQARRAPKKKGPRDYSSSRGGENPPESPRHIHNEHRPRRKRKKSRDRRRKKRRSSSNRVEDQIPRPIPDADADAATEAIDAVVGDE